MGQLWIAEREWVDIMSYHPEMPPAMVHTERDEEFIKLLAAAVTAFSEELERQWEIVRAQYVKDEIEEAVDSVLWLQREDVSA